MDRTAKNGAERRIEMDDVLFNDRLEAGRLLGQGLAKRGTRCSTVLGLIRGGVPVAYEVALALEVPMDILVVKKLRAPMTPELAIGAICADGARVLHDQIISELAVTPEYLSREIAERLQEAQDVERAYRRGQPRIDITGASVVIVDDGIATGATMEAGVLSARNMGTRAVTVAVPVGSRTACESFRRIADDVFCMTQPVEFWAVGQFYLRFGQVSDEEVRDLLEDCRALQEAKSSN